MALSTVAQIAERRAAKRLSILAKARTLREFTTREIWLSLQRDNQYVSYGFLSSTLLFAWKNGQLLKWTNDGNWVRGHVLATPPRTHVARYRFYESSTVENLIVT